MKNSGNLENDIILNKDKSKGEVEAELDLPPMTVFTQLRAMDKMKKRKIKRLKVHFVHDGHCSRLGAEKSYRDCKKKIHTVKKLIE